jgi:hypothetical protein
MLCHEKFTNEHAQPRRRDVRLEGAGRSRSMLMIPRAMLQHAALMSCSADRHEAASRRRRRLYCHAGHGKESERRRPRRLQLAAAQVLSACSFLFFRCLSRCTLRIMTFDNKNCRWFKWLHATHPCSSSQAWAASQGLEVVIPNKEEERADKGDSCSIS